jgi:polar amino acid transport system substrate-binding protein
MGAGHATKDENVNARRTLIGITGAIALLLTACGNGGDQSVLERLQEEGSITVGVANEVPFGYVGDDGEVTGIAPDVARAVLAELGIDRRWTPRSSSSVS